MKTLIVICALAVINISAWSQAVTPVNPIPGSGSPNMYSTPNQTNPNFNTTNPNLKPGNPNMPASPANPANPNGATGGMPNNYSPGVTGNTGPSYVVPGGISGPTGNKGRLK